MKAFAYVKAAGEKQAVAALAAPGGKALPLAGGMDLIGLMKEPVPEVCDATTAPQRYQSRLPKMF